MINITPKNESQFQAQVKQSIEGFGKNGLLRILNSGEGEMRHYHKLLKMIFHQTFIGPSTFALAGANCPASHWEIRDYFLLHAAEERNHWEWIIEDLASTGYKGADPRASFPEPACLNYLSFNFFVAQKQPIARLGIAMVLEGIGATYAKEGAVKICRRLSLRPDQAKFIYGHGDTDVGHSKDILDLLNKSRLQPEDWAWLTFSAEAAGRLYTKMYEDVLNDVD